MLSNKRFARTALAGIGFCAVTGALFGTAPGASATPPLCTAADLASVSAGVSTATAAYLYAHPDVNAYLTGLGDLPKDQRHGDLQQYLDANPEVKADLQLIRQPLADLQDRCGSDTPDS